MPGDVHAPAFRRATAADIEFCWSLYRDLMKPLTIELLTWDDLSQRSMVEQTLSDAGARVIVVGSLDVGWLQTSAADRGVHLGHVYITQSMHNRGIGTAIIARLLDQARRDAKVVTLDVMKNNRARKLYERLGFQAIGSSEHKIAMRWEPDRMKVAT